MSNEDVVNRMREFKEEFATKWQAIIAAWGLTLNRRDNPEIDVASDQKIGKAFKESGCAALEMKEWIEQMATAWPNADRRELTEILERLGNAYRNDPFSQDKFTELETEFRGLGGEFAMRILFGMLD